MLEILIPHISHVVLMVKAFKANMFYIFLDILRKTKNRENIINQYYYTEKLKKLNK